MESESHTSALVDIEATALVDMEAVNEVGRDVPNQTVPGATARIPAREYIEGGYSNLQLGIAFFFSSLPSADAWSQS